MRKTYTLVLILSLIIPSLMFVGNAGAALPTPTIPEFTAKIIANPYDVAPIYTTDPYTGKSVVSQGGYHVENKSIQVKITNQPYSYSYTNGTICHLYYSVRIKGHFASGWTEYYAVYEGISYAKEYTMYCERARYTKGVIQSNSDYTIVTISASNYPNEGQIDIQVQAVVGHDAQRFVNENWHIMDLTYWGHYEAAVAVDAVGDWSNTQTINIESDSTIASTASPSQSTPTPTLTAEPTQNPTATPTQPDTQTGFAFSWGFDWQTVALAVMAIVIVVMAVGMIALWRKVAAK